VLESLWTRTSITLPTPAKLGAYAEPAARKASVREHERIYTRSSRAIRGLPNERRAPTRPTRGQRWQIDLTQPVDASCSMREGR